MPKRPLTVQNKGPESKAEASSSTAAARSSVKRPMTVESSVSKKIKVQPKEEEEEKKPIGKENLPKESKVQPKPKPVPTPIDWSLSEAEDEEEEIDYPTSAINNKDGSRQHPTHKEYLVYDNIKSLPTRVVSKTARYWSTKYLKALNRVHPDMYRMYINNDFNGYGQVEVVENCLLDLTKSVFMAQRGVLSRMQEVPKPNDKVNYTLGFRRLEALTILLDNAEGISGIDDGDRFYELMRVVGACYVTILRGLLPKAMFQKLDKTDAALEKALKKIAKHLPNFKQALEEALIVGHGFLSLANVCSIYTSVIQVVYSNWLLVMENKFLNLNDKSMRTNKKLWTAMKHAVDIGLSGVDEGETESFDFLDELQDYKDSQGEVGGESYDLSKWSKAERAKYSYDRIRFNHDLWF